jgi:receptor expression-enhancing protein 5/6
MEQNDSAPKSAMREMFDRHMGILSQKSGIPAPILVGVLIFCCICVFVGFFGNYITLLVAVVYPAYWSIKAIETDDKEDDKQWLTYWVVFGCFTVFDGFAGTFLQYIPLYFFIKIVFLIWCFLPNTRGAAIIYNNFLIKCFKKYEGDLDNLNEKLTHNVGNAYNSGTNYASANKTTLLKTGFEMKNGFDSMNNKFSGK